MFVEVVILLAVGAFTLKFLSTQDPAPINGVYQQPGKWSFLKYYVFKFIMFMRKRKSTAQANEDGTGAGYGVRSKSNIEEMEKAQKLSLDHPKVTYITLIV